MNNEPDCHLSLLKSFQWPVDDLENKPETLLDFEIMQLSLAYLNYQMWNLSQMILSLRHPPIMMTMNPLILAPTLSPLNLDRPEQGFDHLMSVNFVQSVHQ